MDHSKELNYVPVKRRTREQIASLLSSREPQEIRDGLISAAYWDQDWRWAQERLLSFADHEDELVLWAVVAGLGFIAVFHGDIDQETVRPILESLKNRPALTSDVEETLAEIDHFVVRRKRGEDIDLAKRLSEDWRP